MNTVSHLHQQIHDNLERMQIPNFDLTPNLVDLVAECLKQLPVPPSELHQPLSTDSRRKLGYKIFRLNNGTIPSALLVLKPTNRKHPRGGFKNIINGIQIDSDPNQQTASVKWVIVGRTRITGRPLHTQRSIEQEGIFDTKDCPHLVPNRFCFYYQKSYPSKKPSMRKQILVQDYYRSGSLYQYVKTKPTLAFSQRRELIHDILNALVELHERHEIIHRDIKLQNIFVHKGHAYLGDFGLKCGKDDKQCGQVGTPNYMSPEVAAGASARFASDIWGFGMTLLRWLMPELTESGLFSNLTTTQAILSRLRQFYLHNSLGLSEATNPFESFVLKLLSPRPADRPSARKALEEFQTLVEEEKNILQLSLEMKSTPICDKAEDDSFEMSDTLTDSDSNSF